MAGVMLREIRDYGDSITPWQDRHNMLLSHENSIRRDISKIQESFVWIGIHLAEIDDFGLYDTVVCQSAGDRYCRNIFEYAFQELDLGRSTVYNLLAISRSFVNPSCGLLPEYKDYSYSQLVELLSFKGVELQFADPHLSVRDLRRLKKGEKVYWTDERGTLHDCCLPKLEDIPEEKIQTSGQITSDVFDKEFDDLMSSLDDLISGSKSNCQNEQKSEFLDQVVELCFSSEIEFNRWYYDNYDKEIYPLKISYVKKKGDDQTSKEK